MKQLTGKVAIITGGGSGIGRATALALSQEGARVVVCGRKPETIAETRHLVEQQDGECLDVTANISQEEDVNHLIETVQATFGAVHILVNNAGVSGRGQIHEHDLNTWDKVLATNLRGPFMMCRAVLPLMRAQKQGEIINIGSEMAMENYKGSGAYGIAKHGLLDLSEVIQKENQAYGIRVNTICPGWTYTEMTHSIPQLNPEKTLYPQDIAGMVVWLVKLRPGVRIARPILMLPMIDPWEKDRGKN